MCKEAAWDFETGTPVFSGGKPLVVSGAEAVKVWIWKTLMRISEKKAAGASPAELRPLQEALRDVREVQRLLDGYYEVPRSAEVSAVGWKARKIND